MSHLKNCTICTFTALCLTDYSRTSLIRIEPDRINKIIADSAKQFNNNNYNSKQVKYKQVGKEQNKGVKHKQGGKAQTSKIIIRKIIIY